MKETACWPVDQCTTKTLFSLAEFFSPVVLLAYSWATLNCELNCEWQRLYAWPIWSKKRKLVKLFCFLTQDLFVPISLVIRNDVWQSHLQAIQNKVILKVDADWRSLWNYGFHFFVVLQNCSFSKKTLWEWKGSSTPRGQEWNYQSIIWLWYE